MSSHKITVVGTGYVGMSMAVNETATIIIKSTLPVDFPGPMKDKYGMARIIFSAEFLREGQSHGR